jgi:hypothetical protein
MLLAATAVRVAFFRHRDSQLGFRRPGRRPRRHHEGQGRQDRRATGFAPFGSAGLDLKPQGHDIDMANLIGKELGVKTEIIPVTSTNRIPYLQTRKATWSSRAWARTPSVRR